MTAGIPSANILLSVWEIKGASVPLFSYWHWEALVGSANISLTLILALGSPSVQRYMAYIGTPAPLILPHTMAQIYLQDQGCS